MKYVPIHVKVPGASEEELDLTPGEARKLVQRLQRDLSMWDDLVKKVGIKEARRLMAKAHDRRR